MFTFSYKCEARVFVNTLATNERFMSRMLPQMKRVIELLSDPYCELFRPLTVDYDLIEVSKGVCWSLKKGKFMEDAIEEHQIVCTSQTKCLTQNTFVRFWRTASVQTTYVASAKTSSSFSTTTKKAQGQGALPGRRREQR